MRELTTAVKFDDREYRIHTPDAFGGAGIFLFATQKIVPLLKSLNIDASKLLDMDMTETLRLLADMIGPIINNIDADELSKFMKNCLSYVEILMPAGYMPLFRAGVFADDEIGHSTKTCFVLCFNVVKPILQDFFGDVNWGSLLGPSKTTILQPV